MYIKTEDEKVIRQSIDETDLNALKTLLRSRLDGVQQTTRLLSLHM